MPEDLEVGPRVGTRLTYLIKHALLELKRLHGDELEPFGLDDRELTVLLFLSDREPESQQQAGRRLGVDRTTMVALLDSLERKGLIARRPDEHDRRRNVVVVTADGRKLLTRALRASDEAERRLLESLEANEAAQLRSLLESLAAGRAEP